MEPDGSVVQRYYTSREHRLFECVINGAAKQWYKYVVDEEYNLAIPVVLHATVRAASRAEAVAWVYRALGEDPYITVDLPEPLKGGRLTAPMPFIVDGQEED